MEKWPRERYVMAARNRICGECHNYKVTCNAEKMCSRVENMIDDWMLNAELEALERK